MKTVPTGFSGVPPSGPAMPVTESAQVLSATRRAPLAISAATSCETAPFSTRVVCATLTQRSLSSLA